MSMAAMKFALLTLLLVGFVTSAPTEHVADDSAGVHQTSQTAGEADSVKSTDQEGALKAVQPDKSITPAVPLPDQPAALQTDEDLRDDDVKIVLKAFFENLKNHPAVVEALIEEESERLLQALDDSDVIQHNEESAASLLPPSQPTHESNDKKPVESDQILPAATKGDVLPHVAGEGTAGQTVPEGSQFKREEPSGGATKTLKPDVNSVKVERPLEPTQQNDKVLPTEEGEDVLWDRQSLESLEDGDTFLFPLSPKVVRPRAGDFIIPDLGLTYSDVEAETPEGKGQSNAKASPSKAKDASSTDKAPKAKGKGQEFKDAVRPEGDGGKSAGKSSGAKSGVAGQPTEMDTVPFYYYYYFYDEPVENNKPLAAGGAGGKQETAKIASPVRIGSAKGFQGFGRDNSQGTQTADAGAAVGKTHSPNQDGARSPPKTAMNSIPDIKPAASDVNTDENELKDLVMQSLHKAKAKAI